MSRDANIFLSIFGITRRFNYYDIRISKGNHGTAYHLHPFGLDGKLQYILT